jgi:hypothetical protein
MRLMAELARFDQQIAAFDSILRAQAFLPASIGSGIL